MQVDFHYSVYVLASLDLTRVKIGKARNVAARVRDIRAHSPEWLLLVATVEGYTSVERWFHRRFKANRLYREWFAVDDDLASMILRLQAEGRTATRTICPIALEEDIKPELTRAPYPSKGIRAIMTDDLVQEIRGRYEHGESLRSLQLRFFQFNPMELARVVTGRERKDLPLAAIRDSAVNKLALRKHRRYRPRQRA